MKKIICLLFAIISPIVSLTLAFDSDFYYDGVNVNQTDEISDTFKEVNIDQSDSLLNKQSESFYGNDVSTLGDDRGFAYIQRILNYLLGFCAFIATTLIVYSFINMYVSDDKEGPMKVIKNSAIALIILALSYLIISLIFNVVGTVMTEVDF